MKKVVIIAGLMLVLSGMVWAQHTCREAAPRELRAPSDAAVSLHQGRADFVLLEWEAVEAAAYYRLFREMPVREGADRHSEDGRLSMWVPWASIDAVPEEQEMQTVVSTQDQLKTAWGVAAATLDAGQELLSPIAKARWVREPTPTSVAAVGWAEVKAIPAK